MFYEIDIPSYQQHQLIEITDKIQVLVSEARIENGTALLFVPHTTAAITINENADPDVAIDMVNGLNKLIPLEDDYHHLEGNSAAHIKTSMIGSSEQIIIRNSRLLLGTWQGIYFCEFDGPRKRKLQIKLTKD